MKFFKRFITWCLVVISCSSPEGKYYKYYSIVEGKVEGIADTNTVSNYYEIQSINQKEEVLILYEDKKVKFRFTVYKDSSTYYYAFQRDTNNIDPTSGYVFFVRYGFDSIANYLIYTNLYEPIHYEKVVLNSKDFAVTEGKLNLPPTSDAIKRETVIFDMMKNGTFDKHLKIDTTIIEHYDSVYNINRVRAKYFPFFKEATANPHLFGMFHDYSVRHL